MRGRWEKQGTLILRVEDIVQSNKEIYCKIVLYDGDQVSVKPLYSAEANAEAEAIIKAKSNFLAVTGKNTRVSSNEVIQTLYQMTKNY